jgi:class 3 adenylate cyclase/tetratricopeptide (TPR) repeat protein
VRELIGEGAKKRVYRAHDSLLDRDVAFALIKTEGLDDAGRDRVRREARAMGRLNSHPNIVAVLDLGEEGGQPYLVTEHMAGGDLVAVLEHAPEHRLPIQQVLDVGQQLCRALEHAHARGIIHRDLKPGNIWLTADGTAKLGDFGLAVALDQTRHTQPGMMIGTVSYMAPEQAIGGNVDARSDLYALGCVLYELVCGRPPFVGDESVAIITQHLNTPPVQPSWHRPDVPPGLSALLLRLLEKEPDKRPASADEVERALATIDLAAAAQTGEPALFEDAAQRDSPLYQQIFVGREVQLRQLQTAYDAAISGQGCLLTVVGEPGIGKTALCEQLATYVAVRGGKTLIGHSYEEGSTSIPYLPFVEALRSYVLAREPEDLRNELGSSAGDVARILSEIRDRLHVEARPAGGDPDEDRWRLLEAVTEFLRNASRMQPITLVLEDLHWADRGTLDLLLHLARGLTGARLLVVATYRDVEVDRSHPLSAALAELRRSASFNRVLLRGLTVDEVHRMYQAIRGQEIAWAQAEAVHRQTEGNPLFVQEVLRYLVEEGLVIREAGRWVPQQGIGAGIPEGLRDVIGRRLTRLSSSCNQVLSLAAVIGRDFRLDVLQRVAGMSEDELYAALEEATAAAVVEQRSVVGAGVTFRFAHALFRQTLYEELFVPRRIRFHQQVGRVLEEVHARRLSEHAAEMAGHFAQSTEQEDLAKALHYSELGAARAIDVFAYAEAARLLEQALQVQDVLDPDDRAKRCDLLLALGAALMPAGEPRRVSDEIAPRALALAEESGDTKRIARVSRLALEALHRALSSAAPDTQAWREWAERADATAAQGSSERAYADVAMARLRIAQRRSEEGIVLLRRAVELARDLDDHELFATAAWQAIRFEITPRRWREAVALADELLARPRAGISIRTQGQILEFCGNALLIKGDRDGAERCWVQLTELAERSRDAFLRITALSYTAVIAALDGRLEDAVEIGARLRELGRELGAPAAFGMAAVRCGPALPLLGRAAEWRAWLLETRRNVGMAFSLAISHALVGELEDARQQLQQLVTQDGVDLSEPGPFHLASDLLASHARCLEAAILLEDRPLVSFLVNDLEDSPAFAEPGGGAVCLSRLLGAAAMLLGNPDRALPLCRQAVAASQQISSRPELALSRLGLAEVLLDHYPNEREEALELLDSAIDELRAMKMQPALERAMRRKLHLQGVDSVSPSTSINAVSRAVESEQPSLTSHAAPDGTVTLLFTDIEGSTDLTVRLGDQRWLDILRAHHSLVREHVRAHGGFEVKCQGDGFMLAFQSARRALDCAVAIQRAVMATHTDPPIRVRMGLHTGEALKEADDFHGRDVVLAARIADQADGGEILVSTLLKGLTESSGNFVFDSGRDVLLKGLDGQHRVYGVSWVGQ